MKGPQLVTLPVRLLHPCHIGVTGSHESSPGGDNVLSALSPGEDQKAAWSTAHMMYQLLKRLLKHGRETGTQGRGPGPGEAQLAHPTHRMGGICEQPCHQPACLWMEPGRDGGDAPPHPENPDIS